MICLHISNVMPTIRDAYRIRGDGYLTNHTYVYSTVSTVALNNHLLSMKVAKFCMVKCRFIFIKITHSQLVL